MRRGRMEGIIEMEAKEEKRIRKIMRMRMRIKWRNKEDTKANEEEVKGSACLNPVETIIALNYI
jgi:hypothetical protein